MCIFTNIQIYKSIDSSFFYYLSDVSKQLVKSRGHWVATVLQCLLISWFKSSFKNESPCKTLSWKNKKKVWVKSSYAIRKSPAIQQSWKWQQLTLNQQVTDAGSGLGYMLYWMVHSHDCLYIKFQPQRSILPSIPTH